MSKNERNELSILREKGYSLRDIAGVMNRSIGTLSDEIRKNSVKRKYDLQKAQQKAYVKRHYASFRGKKIVANQKLRQFVDGALGDGQSPEAIAGRLKHHEKHLPSVSRHTIERYRQSPYGKLIGLKLQPKKRSKKRSKKGKLDDRTFIDKRPKKANQRLRIGDVEADFIVSGKSGRGVLLVVVCRKLRTTFMKRIQDVGIDEVHKAFIIIQKRFSEMKTLTLDNDILFKMHKTLEKLLGLRIYFCHPYHSWEKGSVENANKIIRKFIPKGSDLSKYDDEYIQKIEEHLNNRFMKCLNYATPAEAIKKHRQRIKKQRHSAGKRKS